MEFLIEYKQECLSRGEPTPIIDRLVLRSIRMALGGRVRAIMSGGAPLSPKTHNYLRAALSVDLLQGYGLTESCAAATTNSLEEYTSGEVGFPLQCVKLR